MYASVFMLTHCFSTYGFDKKVKPHMALTKKLSYMPSNYAPMFTSSCTMSLSDACMLVCMYAWLSVSLMY